MPESRRRNWAGVGILLVALLVGSPALGREEAAVSSTKKPFTLVVFGDSLADGLWGGLYRALQKDPSIVVLRRARNGTGLSRPDRFNWLKALGQILEEDKPDGALIAFGLNDRQDMIGEPRKRIYLRSDEWTRLYAERVSAIIKLLAERKIAVYWMGLPIMRDEAVSSDIRYLNGIYQKVAAESQVKYFPLWDVAANVEGQFASYDKDDQGITHQYRAEDGIHFTSVGYDRLTKRLLPWMRPDIDAVLKDRAHGP